eukprot:220054-Chlamydomonas_euryale.AAC.2
MVHNAAAPAQEAQYRSCETSSRTQATSEEPDSRLACATEVLSQPPLLRTTSLSRNETGPANANLTRAARSAPLRGISMASRALLHSDAGVSDNAVDLAMSLPAKLLPQTVTTGTALGLSGILHAASRIYGTEPSKPHSYVHHHDPHQSPAHTSRHTSCQVCYVVTEPSMKLNPVA